MNEAMEREGRDAHCREVRELMEGKPPFVTRHGVTVVMAVIAIAMAVLFTVGGPAADLAKGMVGRILEQIFARTEIPVEVENINHTPRGRE